VLLLLEISNLKKKNKDYYDGSFENIHSDWYVFEFKETCAASACKMGDLAVIVEDARTDYYIIYQLSLA
jgi:hypothetical protein